MTPRSGLYVALVGLIIAALCGAVLLLLRIFEESVPPGANDNVIALGGLIIIDLGLLLGLIVIVIGLVLAGILAMTKAGEPS